MQRSRTDWNTLLLECGAEPARLRSVLRRLRKLIDEFVGRVNNGESRLSVALMNSPAGWVEPGQNPEFDEYTLVLEGQLEVTHEGGSITVKAGQAILAKAGEWVRYATPEGCKYVAVCLPAFSPETVHRDS